MCGSGGVGGEGRGIRVGGNLHVLLNFRHLCVCVCVCVCVSSGGERRGGERETVTIFAQNISQQVHLCVSENTTGI